MAFWGADHTEKATINDPKRKFRFLVQIDGMIDADGSGTARIFESQVLLSWNSNLV